MSYTYIGNQSSSFLKAVSANANASFIQANSAYIHTNASYTSQNTTGVYANSAYGAANVADQRAVTSGSYANSAYLLANTKLASAGGIISGDLEVTGNLSVKGEFTSIETETVRIFDNLIDLNSNFIIGTPNENAGIRVIRGDEVAVQFRWNESQAYWQFTNDGINFLKIGSLSGEVYANAAYSAANVADQRAVTSGDYANSSYFKANTNGNYANSAYLAANVADQKAVSAGVYANTAYTHANASYVSQNTTGVYTNTAYTHANASYVSQNTTGVYANAAYAHANTKFPTAGGTISGDVVISGNLTIVGNTVYANTETVVIKDNIVTLNAAIDQSSAPSVDAGIEIDRGSSANVSLIWNETSDRWTFTNDGTIYSPIGSAASESYANSAYIHSNSSYNAANVADQKAVSAGSYANSSYLHANASYVSQNTTGVYANTSYTHANAAYTSQNTTGIYANAAYAHTNASYTSQNTTGVYANTAYLHANSAYQLANVLSTGGSFSVSMVVDNFVGDGITNQFFLSKTPANEDYITVTIEGITQLKSSYMLAGNELIFSEPPINSDRIDVTIFSSAQLDLNTFASNIANVSAVYANAAYNHANAAFDAANNVAGVTDSFARDSANSASIYANSAYDAANTTDQKAVTSGTYANGAYSLANTANTLAQAAFDTANNAVDTWVRDAANSASSYANGAYGVANTSSSYANAAYGQANTVTTNAATADQKAVSAGSYANGAYGVANLAVINSATADQKAVTSGTYANAAYDQANTVNTLAQAAFNAANNAVDTWVRDAANSASSYANGAYGVANTADQKAVSSGSYANGAYGAANTADQKAVSAGVYANGAYGAANTADQKAVSAGVYANGAYGAANTKLSSSGGTISGDLQISGNLIVVGNTVTHSANDFIVDDPIILIANNNIGNLLDVGFVAHYIESSTTKHTGLIRDVSDDIWYLFDNYEPHIQETNILNVSDSSFRVANLTANLITDSVKIRNYDPIDYVNSSFSAANSASSYANVSYNSANSAGSYANSAFNFANTLAGGTATDGWARTAVNSASSYANSGFNIANTADQKAVTSGTYANSSYGQANTATTNAATADQKAVSAGVYANGAYSLANTGNTLAQAAFDAANNAVDTWVRDAANSASSYANGAFASANTSDQKAVTSGNYANGAYGVANTANTNAVTADQKAVSAGVYANASFAHANTGNILAQAAFDRANTVTVDTWVRDASNSSSSYANSAFNKANNSLNVQTGGSITGDVSITGNLTVTGCTSSFIVNSLGTTDNIIDLGVNTTGSPTQNSGIRVLRGDETPVQFRWNETNDHWHYTSDGVNYIRLGSFSDGVYANAAFQSSNSSGSYANSSYLQANTANTNAINAGSYANSAFNFANTLAGGTATDGWARTAANSASSYANSAYAQANTGNTLAQAAFDAANNAVDTWVRDAANSASSYANGAYDVVNVVNQKASSAYNHSNAAFNTANSSSVYANAAFDAANNATDSWVRDAANSASSYANGAYGVANTADQRAVTSGTYANAAYNKANITFEHASAAFDTANAIIGGGNFTLSVVLDNLVGDGINDTFTLTTEPLNENYTLITVEGVTQLRSDYTISGNTITFSEPPENGARIDVTTFSSEVSNLQDAYNKANSAFNVANNSLNVSTGGTITGNIVIAGNITPVTNNTYFLGSDTNRWHSLYVGPGSINIDGIILSNVNGILTISGTDTIQIPNLPDLSLISEKANTANNIAQAAFNAANTKSQFTIASSPPLNANHGDRWFDSDIGQEFVYINDGDSQQWVELSAFVDQNYVEGISYYRLENDYTGLNSTNVQSFFGVGVNLTSNTVYEFESVIFLNKNSGSNTHNLSISFGGTSILNNILYSLDYTNTNVNVIGNSKNILINTTSETTITETTDTNNHILKIKGSLSVNSSGSFVPNYKLSQIPGTSFLTKKGSYFKVKIIGGSEGNNISIGSWF